MAGVFGGIGNNVIYAQGLVRKLYSGYAGSDASYFDARSPYSTDIDNAPINQSWSGSDYSGLWIGYFRPSTSSNTFFLNIFGENYGNFNYLWIGDAAKSGYNSSNALINGGQIGTITLNPGQYYPIRVQIGYEDQSFLFFDSDMSFSMLVNSSSSYDIFYNSLTQGF